jgi:ankyrin repeat protein
MSLFTASTAAEVEELVSQGHDVNCIDDTLMGKTPLIQACENNNIEVIEALCVLGANVNKKDWFELNALDYAMDIGFLKITKYLVETCKMQVTYQIIRAATTRLAVDIIDYFLELGINFSELTNDNILSETLLGAAINRYRSSASIDIVDRLLNAGVNVNEVYGNSGSTALLKLSNFLDNNCQNVIAIIERLILFGADVNHQNCYGYTTLYYFCCTAGNKLVIEMLLKCGADPNILCNKGNAPLIITSKNLHLHQYIPMLLQAGANPTLKNDKGKTAIDTCCDQAMKDLMMEKTKEFI